MERWVEQEVAAEHTELECNLITAAKRNNAYVAQRTLPVHVSIQTTHHDYLIRCLTCIGQPVQVKEWMMNECLLFRWNVICYSALEKRPLGFLSGPFEWESRRIRIYRPIFLKTAVIRETLIFSLSPGKKEKCLVPIKRAIFWTKHLEVLCK